MDCYPQITTATDRPFWIKREDFLRLVHVQNYLCRDVQQLCTNAYLADWFEPSTAGGRYRFSLPSVSLKDGRIIFINGRHRTAVLIEHLEVLPMALVNVPGDDIHEALFGSIKHADLSLTDLLQIPDLPILSKAELDLLIDRSSPRVPTPDPW